MRFISDLWRHIYVAECKWIVHTQLDSNPIDMKCKWALTVFVLWLFQVSRGLWKEKKRIVVRLGTETLKILWVFIHAHYHIFFKTEVPS